MITPNPPTGMRDFLPTQKMLRVIRETYRAHGFDEIETPALEEIERLTNSDGGDNQKMVFTTLRRRLQPEQIGAATQNPAALSDLGLRYDLTVPLARFYATNRAALPQVFRAIQMGPVWRAERPQRGRYRQFTQCDIDIVGEPGVLAEGELFQATADVLDALDIEDWRIRVNSRVLLAAVLDSFNIPAAQQGAVYIAIDKLDKIGFDGVTVELGRLNLNPESERALLNYLQQVTAGDMKLDTLPSAISGAAADIRGLFDVLPAAVRERVTFDPLLIRGMGYYTGLIYEIGVPGLNISIGGGGRYDGMINRLAGIEVPAVGMSLGFERLVDLVALPGRISNRGVVLVYDRDVSTDKLLAFKAELVAAGSRVRLERRPRKFPELFRRLQEDGYGSFATVRADTTYLNIKGFYPT